MTRKNGIRLNEVSLLWFPFAPIYKLPACYILKKTIYMTHFIFWSFPSSRQWPRINISKGQKGIYYKETTETLSKGNRRRLHADYWRPLVGIFTDEIITGNFYNLKDKRLRGEGGVGCSLVEPVRSRLWIPSSGLSQKRFHALLVNFAIISTVNLASKWASQGW